MRGAILLVPLCVIIALLVIIARPNERKATTQNNAAHSTAISRDTTIALRPFEPNTADYHTLVEAGIPREVAVGIIRWREAGKVYRIKEDLALCYSMTDSLYHAIEPYIIIGKEYQFPSNESIYEEHARPAVREAEVELAPFMLDSVGVEYLRALGFTARQAELVIRYRDMIGGYRTFAEFEECYAVDSAMAARLHPYIIFPPRDTATTTLHDERIEFTIDINSADSALLCRVAGIGAKSASHILYYRELLGGYHSVIQISELKVVTDENFQRILPQIWCDSAKIKKININFATSNELQVHPYISNRMLKSIINNRELKGGWSNLEEMIEDDIFSTEEAMRIAPYLDFSVSQ